MGNKPPPYGGQWKDPSTGKFSQSGYEKYLSDINKKYIESLVSQGKRQEKWGYTVGGQDVGLGGMPAAGGQAVAAQAPGTTPAVAPVQPKTNIKKSQTGWMGMPSEVKPRVARGAGWLGMPAAGTINTPSTTIAPWTNTAGAGYMGMPAAGAVDVTQLEAMTSAAKAAEEERKRKEGEWARSPFFGASVGPTPSGLAPVATPAIGGRAGVPLGAGGVGVGAGGGIGFNLSDIMLGGGGVPQEVAMPFAGLGVAGAGGANRLGGGRGPAPTAAPVAAGTAASPTSGAADFLMMQEPGVFARPAIGTAPPSGYPTSPTSRSGERLMMQEPGAWNRPIEGAPAPTPTTSLWGYPPPAQQGGGGGKGDGGGYGGWGAYSLEGAPEWWKGLAAGSSEDQQFASILNAMIPSMSPEDQRTAASTLSRMFPEFESYNTLTNQGVVPPVPGEVTNETAQGFETSQRAQQMLAAIQRMGAAGGMQTGTGQETPAAIAWLQQLADLFKDYGISGATERMSATQLQALMAGLDPLLAEAKGAGSKVAPYAEIARMITQPFFSAGQVWPKSTGTTGQVQFGQKNPRLY